MMIAEGMFCRQLLGTPREKQNMKEAAAYLNSKPPDAWKMSYYYYWYYATVALYQHQGPFWRQWNENMKNRLLASQVALGRHKGSWDPVGRHAGYTGRVVSTALATLSLEVYYRYLPLYGLSSAMATEDGPPDSD
jgi:hypothetical protein